MTIVGKIFTVLIFILSVMFLAFSVVVFNTHEELEDQVKALNAKNITLQEDINSQTEERDDALEKLAQEQSARAYAIAALEAELQTAVNERDLISQDLTLIEAENTNLSSALKVAERTKERLSEEVAQIRTEIQDSQQSTDEMFLEVLRLTDSNNAQTAKLQLLVEREKQLVHRLARMNNVLRKNQLDEFSDVHEIPPVLDGVVTAVQKDLLQISLGHDDGIRQGHELDVYRGTKYVGRVQVRETNPSSAVCEIIPNYLRDTIRKDDLVATKLN